MLAISLVDTGNSTSTVEPESAAVADLVYIAVRVSSSVTSAALTHPAIGALVASRIGPGSEVLCTDNAITFVSPFWIPLGSCQLCDFTCLPSYLPDARNEIADGIGATLTWFVWSSGA